VAIAKAIEAAIGKRQGQRTDKELPKNFSEVVPGKETRKVAAERAGFGNPITYQQAKRVVERGVQELVEAMDAAITRGALRRRAECDRNQAMRSTARTADRI
jgi:hypothetical protein